MIDGENSTQGWNRYSYVKNNPIVYKDPTGHAGEKNESSGLINTLKNTWNNVTSTVSNKYDSVKQTMQDGLHQVRDFVGKKLAKNLGGYLEKEYKFNVLTAGKFEASGVVPLTDISTTLMRTIGKLTGSKDVDNKINQIHKVFGRDFISVGGSIDANFMSRFFVNIDKNNLFDSNVKLKSIDFGVTVANKFGYANKILNNGEWNIGKHSEVYRTGGGIAFGPGISLGISDYRDASRAYSKYTGLTYEGNTPLGGIARNVKTDGSHGRWYTVDYVPSFEIDSGNTRSYNLINRTRLYGK